MNFKLLFVSIALVLGALLGNLLLQDTGYILISFHQWVFETSLWVFLALISIVIIVGFVFLSLIHISEPTRPY